MNIKRVVMIMLCSFVGQSVTAAVVAVTNGSGQTLEVYAEWNGGRKGTIMFPNDKRSLNSGYNPIYRVTWKLAQGEIGSKTTREAVVSISNPVSLSHKLSIGANGMYQYDNGSWKNAQAEGSSLENDWTEL